MVVALSASMCVVATGPKASAEPTWLPTVDVTSGTAEVTQFDVDHLPDATRVAVWDELPPPGSSNQMVYFAARALGEASFSSSEPLSQGDAYSPQVEVDGQGTVTVAWLQSDGNGTVWVSRLAAGATQWPAPQLVTSPSVRSFQLLVDRRGTVTVVSRHVLSGQRYRLDATTRSVDGSWTAGWPVASETADMLLDPRAVVDGHGRSRIGWAFGDGATATGASTSHTHAAPGTYQVTVTATDAVGNSSTRTRPLTVSAPAAPPAPPGPPAPPAPPAGDQVAPVLSSAKVKPRTLPVTTKATLRVTSTEPARVMGVVQLKKARGWKRVARKQCSVERGANTEKLYGQAAQLRLQPGKYRIRLVATDPAGNTSAASTIGFRVDRG